MVVAVGDWGRMPQSGGHRVRRWGILPQPPIPRDLPWVAGVRYSGPRIVTRPTVHGAGVPVPCHPEVSHRMGKLFRRRSNAPVRWPSRSTLGHSAPATHPSRLASFAISGSDFVSVPRGRRNAGPPNPSNRPSVTMPSADRPFGIFPIPCSGRANKAERRNVQEVG